jgi:glycosyltransferase involved in cell wall biosynthesis
VDKKDDVNLVFIGDGDDLLINYLLKLIRYYGLNKKVFFLGRKENPYMYLSKAKVLAITSHYEGTPNVIVEALALKIPVVSSNCTDGIGELMSLKNDVERSNDNIEVEGGIITPNLFKDKMGIPDTINDIQVEEIKLADALQNALHKPAYKLRVSKNSEALTRKFNLESVCNQYLD